MAEIDANQSSWAELFHRRHAAALATLSLGITLHALNGFLVSTALPNAVIEIDGVEWISWAFTVYLVASILGGALAALLKGRFGVRATFFWAALVFLAGTLAAGLAPSMPVLLLGRVGQGAGDGVIFALCYVLIPALFPSRLVPKVFGVEAAIWAVAAFGGPLVAGLITEFVSWRASFLFNVPLIVLFVVMVPLVVPAEVGAGAAARVPFMRLAGCGAGIMLIAVAGILPGTIARAAAVAAALALLAAVFWRDRRATDRLFPRQAFTLSGTVGAGLWVILLMPVAQASTAVYLNLTIQRLWGYGPTVAAAISALMAISWSVVALGIASFRAPVWPRAMVRLGPLLVSAGVAGSALGVAIDALWLVMASQIGIGTGFGISWAYISQAVMEAAPADERDRASGLLPTVLTGGYALGAALAGLVASIVGLGGSVEPGVLAGAVVVVFGVASLFGLGAFCASWRVMPREG